MLAKNSKFCTLQVHPPSAHEQKAQISTIWEKGGRKQSQHWARQVLGLMKGTEHLPAQQVTGICGRGRSYNWAGGRKFSRDCTEREKWAGKPTMRRTVLLWPDTLKSCFFPCAFKQRTFRGAMPQWLRSQGLTVSAVKSKEIISCAGLQKRTGRLSSSVCECQDALSFEKHKYRNRIWGAHSSYQHLCKSGALLP